MTEHHHGRSGNKPGTPFWLIGLVSLAWLLLRSGFNPKRLNYPCQRAALLGSLNLLLSLLSFPAAVSLHGWLKRRGGIIGAGIAGALVVMSFSLINFESLPTGVIAAQRSYPAWTSATAISNVFVVPDVPIPPCSLDGATLPATAPCNDPDYALSDAGIDRLITLMEAHGDYFYRTAAHPTGLVAANDVVVIKINNQWMGYDSGSTGYGRLATNGDVLKGLIWSILQHPGTFTGEIVVAENTQWVNPNWDTNPANAQDQDQSYQDVVTVFQGLGYDVFVATWDDLNANLISGGPVGAAGYPTGEYADGNNSDAYILLEDAAGSGINELSYPKFQTPNGTKVSMRYGIWNGSSYNSDRLTFINLPCLKKHCMASSTIAWKNLVGFVTISDNETRFSDSDSWSNMHDFFWGYTGGTNQAYGLLGREIALIRPPDLNIVDAIWVAYEDNTGGEAVRLDTLLASRDPFAVDWYASEYVLQPQVTSDPQASSAARAGNFRTATRINQNAAAAVWPGGAYPYIDLFDSYDGDTPSTAEKNQMNAYVYAASAVPRETSPAGTMLANRSDGSITVTYTAGCGAADHTVYGGNLSLLASSGIAWSERFCNRGTSGGLTFSTTTPNLYFVVVGNDGASVEGSYGRSSSGLERLAAGTGAGCSYTQNLVGTCP